MYLSGDSLNNNTSIWALNYKVFRNSKMDKQPATGYKANESIYLWANATENLRPKFKDLSFLGRPGPYTIGPPLSELGNDWNTAQQKLTDPKNWGNPFHPNILNLDTQVYKTTLQTTNFTQDMWDKYMDEEPNKTKFTITTEPLVQELRYNPDRDTGEKTTIYLVSNTTSNQFEIPADDNITIKGFPLYLGLWSWIDWQKKLNYIHNIDSTYILCFQSPFTEPRMDPITTPIIPIDRGFLDGKGPYNLDHEDLSKWTLDNWYPKVAHQLVTIDHICSCDLQ